MIVVLATLLVLILLVSTSNLLLGVLIMAAIDDLKAILVRIDVATTNIAADITAIKDKISGSMSAAEVAEVQAGLEAAASRLEALDAENPDGQPTT